MRDDFDAIPEAVGRSGSVLTHIYHDIGLAAVADALDLLAVDFDPDMNQSLERGEFYLMPVRPEPARASHAS